MLLDAVVRGRIYQVKFLLESNAVNVNATDEKGQTALMKAILLDDRMHRTRYKVVRCLLEHGAKVNITDKDGRNALMLAAMRGQEDLAAKMLQKAILDLDLNAVDKDGNTALIHAALRGHSGIVRLLINALKRFGLGVDKKNQRGMTAILEATKNSHDKCAEILITQGDASLTIRDPESRMSTREWADKLLLVNLLEVIRLKTDPAEASDNIEDANNKTEEGLVSDKTDKTFARSPSNVESGGRIINDEQETVVNPSRNGSPLEQVKARPSSRRRTGAQANRLTVPRVMQTLAQGGGGGGGGSTPDLFQGTPRTDISSVGFLSTTSGCLESGRTTRSEGRNLKSDLGSHSTATTRHKPIRRSSTGSAYRPITAKSEMLRLLQLYGEQTSETFRAGYDPSALPPSGFWPDPLSHLRGSLSGSCENVDQLDADLFSEYMPQSRPSSRRKSTVLELPTSSRRMSIVGGKDRKISTAGRGRGFSPLPGGRSLLHPEGVGRKISVAADRRGSMMTRPVMERPVLTRKHYSTLATS